MRCSGMKPASPTWMAVNGRPAACNTKISAARVQCTVGENQTIQDGSPPRWKANAKNR